eukprot:scaffold26486_cov118-Isochrysis_galbana.AAC.7
MTRPRRPSCRTLVTTSSATWPPPSAPASSRRSARRPPTWPSRASWARTSCPTARTRTRAPSTAGPRWCATRARSPCTRASFPDGSGSGPGSSSSGCRTSRCAS